MMKKGKTARVRDRVVETKVVGYDVIHIDSIGLSGHNPASRTSTSSLEQLKAMIAAQGILMPLLVTEQHILIDGHRRLECARQLGIEMIPVIVVKTDDGAQLFMNVNTGSRKLTSSEWLEVYMQGGSVPARIRSDIEKLNAIGGRQLLERLKREHISPRMIDIARLVVTRIGGDHYDLDLYRKVISWMVEGRRQWQARHAVKYAYSVPPKVLYDAIVNDRDLQVKYI
jgi:hypothetical protein